MNPERRRAYTSSRDDVVRLLPRVYGPVLDVGCSTGEVARAIKDAWGPDTSVVGVEIDPESASQAMTVLDHVHVGDASEILLEMGKSDFSPALVIFADSLEHMEDPWSVFDLSLTLLHDGSHIVASVPNVAHWDTFYNLARGRWPYRSRGIHDSTHLRFFGRRNVEELMSRGDAELIRMHRVLRLVERPHPLNRWMAWLCRLLPGPFTFQWIAVSRVCRSGSLDGSGEHRTDGADGEAF